MQDCVRCKNHSICRLEHRNLTEKCAFVNPTEEIPIIHGKAELEEHDKRIRNKAIDDFTKEIVAEYDNDGCPNVTDYLDYRLSIRELFEIAEQMKGV